MHLDDRLLASLTYLQPLQQSLSLVAWCDQDCSTEDWKNQLTDTCEILRYDAGAKKSLDKSSAHTKGLVVSNWKISCWDDILAMLSGFLFFWKTLIPAAGASYLWTTLYDLTNFILNDRNGRRFLERWGTSSTPGVTWTLLCSFQDILGAVVDAASNLKNIEAMRTNGSIPLSVFKAVKIQYDRALAKFVSMFSFDQSAIFVPPFAKLLPQ